MLSADNASSVSLVFSSNVNAPYLVIYRTPSRSLFENLIELSDGTEIPYYDPILLTCPHPHRRIEFEPILPACVCLPAMFVFLRIKKRKL